jgi:glycosyltransferase involved in cell wall biosynthesis
MSKVTIGVPVYNGAATLRACLECLENQTYRDVEIVVSDNASTDNSAEIAQEFVDRDPRFRLVRKDINVGPVLNFFSLLDEAKTYLFMWRADDDWSDPDYIARLKLLFDKNPGVSLVAGRAVYVRPDGQVVGVKPYSTPKQRTRAFRIGHMLMNLSPNSIYGLWDRVALKEVLVRTRESYPYVWAWDHIAMTPMILREAVIGDNSACLYVGQPEILRHSSQQEPRMMWEMRRRFRQVCFEEMRRQEWSFWERPIVVLFLLRYANVRVFRFWKTVRRQIRYWLGA